MGGKTGKTPLAVCISAEKVMALYSGIAASDFTLVCYVRNVMFSLNLHCQHRAIMPPQQKCKNRLCKENESNEPSEQCPRNSVSLKTTGVVLIFSPEFFRDVG